MATIRVKVIGQARLKTALRRVSTSNRTGVSRAIGTAGALVQGDAQRSIQRGTRTGAVVTIAGKKHQRSAKGEPPKTDTGRLVSSIFAEFDESGLEIEVGSDVEYATWLEFGTKDKKLGERPWLQPAFERNKDQIKAVVRAAIKAANRAAGGRK